MLPCPHASLRHVLAGGGGRQRARDEANRRRHVLIAFPAVPCDESHRPLHPGGDAFPTCERMTRSTLNPVLARMFEQAPTFMALLSGPDHRFELTNPSYQKLIGEREVLGLTVAEGLPETAAQGFLDILDEVYRTGMPYRADAARYEMQVVPGGPRETRYLDFVYQPLRDAEERVTGIFVEGADVTDRVLAQKLRNESEAFYEWLFDSIDEGFCIIQFFDGPHGPDSDYVHIRANAAYARHAGIPNVVGRKLREMVGDEADAWVERYGAVLRTGEPIRFQQELVATGRYLELTALRLEPRSRGQVAVFFHDITEQRLAEAALARLNATLEQRVEERTSELMALEETLRHSQKMEAVGQLTGGIAHDFNNLLAGIGGSLEMLSQRLAQGRLDDLERYVSGALTATRRATALTQRLLAYSRRQTLDPSPLDVNLLAEGMLDLIGRSVGPQVTVKMERAGALWTTFADPGQLESALLNLCVNARDAMPHGGSLVIRTANARLGAQDAPRHGLKPGDYVALSVSDTGTGMTEEIAAHAFEPFYTTKPMGQGTGLGLSMVYGFAGQSGGGLGLETAPGRGTTITVYLPRRDMAPGQVVDTGTPVAAETAAGSTAGTILVVDDEPLIRMMTTERLEDEGYIVLEAANGAKAMQILGSDRPIDLLVTDVGLPGGMNGRQVADAARRVRPDLRILFITGYAEQAVLHHGDLERGMQILTKPFDMEQLNRRVRALLAGT
ncbi:hybrid sensor histidine kinase/response regulator [Haematobacter genomosp. 1]|uniref:histidine kinase n=2 Tax=Haematobacter genomosp. 1 TaxID=366618 RepID=A0A212AEJ8_9RHOB|nr:hybrid sensor histidine kinase/response regulator [Haematobacter genomosp. 1]